MGNIKTLKFTKESTFTGRNGYFKSSGIEINGLNNSEIIFNPITTRRKLGNCDIVIPIDNIPEFINNIRDVYNSIKEEELISLKRELSTYKEHLSILEKQITTKEQEEYNQSFETLESFQ